MSRLKRQLCYFIQERMIAKGFNLNKTDAVVENLFSTAVGANKTKVWS